MSVACLSAMSVCTSHVSVCLHAHLRNHTSTIHLIMAAHGQYMFCSCRFCLSFFCFFPRLFSAVGDWMSTILPHMCGLSANLKCMSEMCCMRLAENTGRKNYAKNCHLRAIIELCLVWLYLRN